MKLKSTIRKMYMLNGTKTIKERYCLLIDVPKSKTKGRPYSEV